jgi:hypothetical protein
VVVNACVESFWRIFFELASYSLNNLVFVILTLLLIYSFGKTFGSLILSFAAAAADFIIDSALLASAGITTFVSVLAGIAIGMIWALMTLTAKEVPLLVRIPNAILMFFVGVILGLVPFPPLAFLAIGIGIVLNSFPAIGYVIGIFMFAGLYFLLSSALPLITPLCSGLSYVINLF